MNKKERILSYFELDKKIAKKRKDLEDLQSKQNMLFLSPFKTCSTYINALYLLDKLFENPDDQYFCSSNLLIKRGSKMYFSDETMRRDLPKIFKHFKDIGILVKQRNKKYYVLNKIIKDFLTSKQVI